jgi:hypothetical protein
MDLLDEKAEISANLFGFVCYQFTFIFVNNFLIENKNLFTTFDHYSIFPIITKMDGFFKLYFI